MIKKIFLSFAAIGLFLSITAVALYVFYPRTLVKAFVYTSREVISFAGKDAPYDTEYGLHPLLDTKLNALISDAGEKGIDLRVVSGYRSLEHQQRLYEKGRTRKGNIVTNAPAGFSYHNYGFAVDVCEFVDGKPHWGSKHWDTIGRMGKKHGLVWGGDWKSLVDKPHFQLSLKDIMYIIFTFR
jgi:peptidoglycan L-alanyl-D-glutamate endopeptidase CwlK